MARKRVIPKKIAGYKIPKSLRKSRLLNHLLRSPLGREILANALTAGAGAAAAALVRHRDELGDVSAEGARRGKRTVAILTRAAHEGADAMMGVVADAARAVAGQDGDGGRDGGRKRSQRH